MIPFLKLIRYKNLLMILLTMVLTKYALIPNYLSSANLSLFEFSLLATSIVFIAAAGYIINDFFDIIPDKINKPTKTYIPKPFSKKSAIIIYCLLNIVGLITAFYVSDLKDLLSIYWIFVVTVFLLFLYSWKLKKLPIIGNLLVSVLVPTVIFITYQFDEILITKSDFIKSFFLSLTVFYYQVFAFLATFIREIIKDLEDIKGDYKSEFKTLPIVLGIKRTRNLAIGISFIMLFIFFIFLNETIASNLYIFAALIVVVIGIHIYFTHYIWTATTKKEFTFLSRLIKIIMFVGILSMLLFKIN